MNRLRFLPLAAVAAALLLVAASAQAQMSVTETFSFRVNTTAPAGAYWDGEHGDIDVHSPSPGVLEMHYHFHDGDSPEGGNGFPSFDVPIDTPPLHEGEEVEAADLTVWINSALPAAQRTRAAGTQWDFTGVTDGSPFYVLPVTDTPGLPFLGFSAEEVSFDVLYSLVGVSGPGVISAWTEDGFGEPTPLWSSVNLSGPSNPGILVPGFDHEHVFIGFSEVGDYSANITAVPEPGSVGLAAVGVLGMAGIAVVRRRRQASADQAIAQS